MRIRPSSKVVLVDEHDRVLLFRVGDVGVADEDTWWCLAGGGREEGETPEACAVREVFEETGFTLDAVGPAVGFRRFEATFRGEPFVGEETYFVARVPAFEIVTDNWTDVEREVTREHRWWPLDELAGAAHPVLPEDVEAMARRYA